jgi:predicted nucleic acid-binding protein
MNPAKLVLDAGPIISLFKVKDAEHALCVQAFENFAMTGTRLITPTPIIFEVYKRLLYDATRTQAVQALRAMLDSLEVIYLNDMDLIELENIVNSMPRWNGSLEDAAVALVTMQQDVPIWTFNYRDLAAFRDLEFWTPSTQ